MSAVAMVNVREELLADNAVRQLVDDVTDVMKLEIVQSLRGLQPAAPSRGGARRGDAHGGQVAAVVVRRLEQLPPARREVARAGITLTPTLKRAADRLGVVTDGRMAAAKRPVLAQVDLRRTFGGVERSEVARRVLSRLQAAQGTGGAIANSGVRFLLHQVTCVKDTKEVGKDEILIGGVAVDADSTQTTIPESNLGKFKKGDSHSFTPAKELAAYNLSGEFPKNFAVFVALGEKDLGGFSEFLAALYDSIEDEVAVVLTAVGAAAGVLLGAKFGAELGAIIGGPLGVIIGAVAGAILGGLVAWLVNVTKDEVFAPQVAGLALPSADADFGETRLSSGPLTLTFADHGGTYQVRYSWELRR